ncbi:MAG: hypothetical protein GXO94_03110 [Nitrospirae bacterium]|nr:hypothetical protein [Nitrospirota bacterium]
MEKKQRDVISRDFLALTPGNRRTSSKEFDELFLQPLNLSDERTADLFVNEWLRQRLYGPWFRNNLSFRKSQTGLGMGFDMCSFVYSMFGVLDNKGYFHSLGSREVKVPKGFPRNQEEYLRSISVFLENIKRLAPDLTFVCNEGSIALPQGLRSKVEQKKVSDIDADLEVFKQVYKHLDGVEREDVFENAIVSLGNSSVLIPAPEGRFARMTFAKIVSRHRWLASEEKLSIVRAVIPADYRLPAGFKNKKIFARRSFTDRVRIKTMAYLLLRGPNSFYAPQFDDKTTNGEQLVETIFDRLGLPDGQTEWYGNDDGYFRLYWRKFDGGVVLLNFSGQQVQLKVSGTGLVLTDFRGKQTNKLLVPLKVSGLYLPDGSPINKTSSLTLDDVDGTYVLLKNPSRPTMPRPRIDPRGILFGPKVTVTIRLPEVFSPVYPCKVPAIFYTTDNWRTKKRYAGPFQLTGSAVVRAKAECNGYYPSFEGSALFRLSRSSALAGFHFSSQKVDEFERTVHAVVDMPYPAPKDLRIPFRVSTNMNSSEYGVNVGLKDGNTSNSLVIRKGARYGTIAISLYGDLIQEGAEKLTIILDPKDDTSLVDPKRRSFTLTVEDNDGKGNPVDYKTCTPSMDAFVRRDASVGYRGDKERMAEIGLINKVPFYALIKVDLQRCLGPENVSKVKIKQAILTGYVPWLRDKNNDKKVTAYIYRVTQDWDRGKNTNGWKVPPKHEQKPSLTANVFVGGARYVANWDVTGDARYFLDSPGKNHGWLIAGDPKSEDAFKLYLKETEDTRLGALIPRLHIIYTKK